MPDIIRLLFQIGGGVRKKGDHGEVIGEGYGGGSHALDMRPQNYREPFLLVSFSLHVPRCIILNIPSRLN
jgi:hypothetical protein